MMPGVKISASTKQKDEITLEGNDIELVSRSGKFRLLFFKRFSYKNWEIWMQKNFDYSKVDERAMNDTCLVLSTQITVTIELMSANQVFLGDGHFL